MSALDLLLVYLAIGAALFATDLLFTPWSEHRDLWLDLRRRAWPLVVLVLLFATLLVALWWSVLWPLQVGVVWRRVRR